MRYAFDFGEDGSAPVSAFLSLMFGAGRPDVGPVFQFSGEYMAVLTLSCSACFCWGCLKD
jgi:hypothetical protein